MSLGLFSGIRVKRVRLGSPIEPKFVEPKFVESKFVEPGLVEPKPASQLDG